MVDIIIDDRETEKVRKYLISAFIDMGFSPKVERLPAGDFLIFGKTDKDRVLIERKTASDFLGSIEGKKIAPGHWKKGRIWDQIKRMKETKIPELTVLIEGNPFSKRLTAYRKKGFNKNRIWGAMRSIRRRGVGIERTKDLDETIEYVAYIMKQKKGPKKISALRTSPPNSMTLKERKLYVLQGLPGVGPKKSREILKKYKTLKSFFKVAETSSLFGDKTKKELKKILN